MKVVKTEVTYIYENDLVSSAKNLPIEEISFIHINDREILYKADVLILSINGDYRVVKSRY